MKGSALLFMLISWNIITGLCTFCFTRMFAAGPKNAPKSRRRR
ncbi:hypothetical protein [Thermosulfurimonas marina]|nr:hypothetical protein [Thermosulfurimonas marina]